MTDCAQAFRQALEDFGQLHFPPQRLLVGLSGGLDSMVLLQLCCDYFLDITHAVHVNQGYSQAAPQWQRHCEQACQRLQVPLTVAQAAPAATKLREADARAARYRIFEEQLQVGELLLLAHHADDQAETLLLHILQGRGAFGMPALRRLGTGWLLRPLLTSSRQSLLEYASERQLNWIEDPSNLDVRHDRNFLRHEIMPALSARFAPLLPRLQQVADHTRSVEGLLIDALQLDRPALPLQRLRGRPTEEQLAILRGWLTARERQQPSSGALQELLRQLQQSDYVHGKLALPDFSLRCYRGRIFFVETVTASYTPVPITGPVDLKLPQGTLAVTCPEGGVEADTELVVRFWQQADAPAALPRKILLRGRHRSIRELLRAAGVPPWQRDGYPLVCDAGEVLVVPGVACRDDRQASGSGLEFAWRPVGSTR